MRCAGETSSCNVEALMMERLTSWRQCAVHLLDLKKMPLASCWLTLDLLQVAHRELHVFGNSFADVL